MDAYEECFFLQEVSVSETVKAILSERQWQRQAAIVDSANSPVQSSQTVAAGMAQGRAHERFSPQCYTPAQPSKRKR
ncbi:hypothetical protein PQQ51_19490 [Paraburkholderia xenovorans]|uniref:hypothetical protein n=1 Tax=Paraburkholderia xenovorans TaxID=36873 RepID=UPI0038B8C398